MPIPTDIAKGPETLSQQIQKSSSPTEAEYSVLGLTVPQMGLKLTQPPHDLNFVIIDVIYTDKGISH